MTDLIDRLRKHALPDPHDEREVLHAPLLRDAADALAARDAEIVRLTDELTATRKQRTDQFFRISRLTQEVERLRRAAQRVVDDMRRQHDSRPIPSKWGAPFGAIAELSDVLEKFPDAARTADQNDEGKK